MVSIGHCTVSIGQGMVSKDQGSASKGQSSVSKGQGQDLRIFLLKHNLSVFGQAHR